MKTDTQKWTGPTDRIYNDIFDWIPGILGASESPNVLEVGVGLGDDSARICRQLVRMLLPYRFIGFEPQARNWDRIRSITSGLSFELIGAAIGDRVGYAPFIGSGDWPLSGSVKKPVKHLQSYPWIKWDSAYDVPMLTLDFACEMLGLGEIAFIWADVQGGEDMLIAGGMETLASTRYFYSECYEQEEYQGQIGRKEILKRLGPEWEIAEEWSENVLFRNKSML